jgi:hypothetical protein
MESAVFVPFRPYEIVDTHWEVPNFVAVEMSSWRLPLGASVNDILVYGMTWSLSRLQHYEWDTVNLETFFKPELQHFVKTLYQRRQADFVGFRIKISIDEKLSQNTEIGISVPLSQVGNLSQK